MVVEPAAHRLELKFEDVLFLATRLTGACFGANNCEDCDDVDGVLDLD